MPGYISQTANVDRAIATIGATVLITLTVMLYNLGSSPASSDSTNGEPVSFGSKTEAVNDLFATANDSDQNRSAMSVEPPPPPPPPAPPAPPVPPLVVPAPQVAQVASQEAPVDQPVPTQTAATQAAPSPAAPTSASNAVTALTNLGERPQVPVEQLTEEQVRQECVQYMQLIHKGQVQLKVDYRPLQREDMPTVAAEYVATSANSRVRISSQWQATPLEAGSADRFLIGDLNRTHWPAALSKAIQDRFGANAAIKVCFVLNDRTALLIYRSLAAKGSCLRPGLECEVRLVRQGETLQAEVIRPTQL
jgi:hypothetical protein